MATEIINLRNKIGIKAYYQFSAGALTTDSSGNSHTLTAISVPAEVAGRFNGGASFTTDDAYSATDGADFKPTGVFSVHLWVKTSVAATSGLFQSWNYTTNMAGFEVCVASNGTLWFRSAKNTGAVQGTDYQQISSVATINDNAWHQCDAIWDGSYLRTYVDGVASGGAVSWSYAPGYDATNYVRIACLNETSNKNFLTGSLDDVVIWNGRALTALEVRGLYYSSLKGPYII